jgi:hypothetical protein
MTLPPPGRVKTPTPLAILAGGVCFFGCVRGEVADTAVVVTDTPPAITTATVACDAENAEWAFAVATDAWTGNGQLLWTTDGDYLEKHTLYSSEAAEDGSWDHLDLELSIVADWQDAASGSSTAFNCSDSGLTGILRVFTRTGGDVADCRVFGTEVERWDAWDLGATCETVLE